MAALEKPVGRTTLPHLLQQAVAQTVTARRTTPPAVSKHTGQAMTSKTIKSKTLDSCLSSAEQEDGATVSSQPADSTSPSGAEMRDTVDEGGVLEDGEPSAAELRRRRLRKLEAAAASSPPPPPPDN